MLASIFIIQGYDTFRHPERVAAKAEPIVTPIAERVPAVPAKPEQAVRLNGAVQVVAGSMLAIGRFPRLSALVLIGSLVPTTLAGHRFWEAEDDASKAQQRIHFLKNLSMLGGLAITAVDTEGKPSLVWRVRYAAKSAGKSATGPARSARTSVRSAQRDASRTAQTARRDAARSVQTARQEAARKVRTARREAALAVRTAKVSGKAGAKTGKLAARVSR
jgi:uncharacterized membrane protein YphA (DoxX/SURF4 family)